MSAADWSLTFGYAVAQQGQRHAGRHAGNPRVVPDFVYIVLGDASDLGRRSGRAFRLSLERLARARIRKHVIFYNQFVELNELTEFIRAADVCVTPI